MEVGTLNLIIAAFLALLVLLVPQMLRLRIGVLRWLGWERFASFHEAGFRRIVFIVRLILITMIVIVLAVELV